MQNRPETGAMRFKGDWTGVFIRGDEAFCHLMNLKRLVDSNNLDSDMTKFLVKGMISILASCIHEQGKAPEAQVMKNYCDCVDDDRQPV